MTTYIGFRVEVASRVIGANATGVVKKYNAKNDSQIFDLFMDGRITIERKDSMVIARGTKDAVNRRRPTNVNFAIMVPIEANDVDRIVQIVNVLGNGRLIRERVKIFIDGQSAINHIPEFDGLITAFTNLEKMAPGLITSSWYYAPEAKFEDEDE